MTLDAQDQTLRKYLLGELSETDQEALELWLMSDAEALERLAAAEDDLIDESISGTLNHEDSERFTNYFLVAPERKRKLVFSQAFRKFVNEAQRTPVSQAVPTTRFTFWELFRYQRPFAFATSALILVIAGAGLWAGFRVQDLERQLDSAATQLEAERQGYKQRMEAQEQRLQSDLQALEQAVASVKSAQPVQSATTLVAVALMPGLSRAPGDIQTIALTPRTQLAEISLTLLDDNYDSYRAVVIDSAGDEVWTRERLMASLTRDGKAVVLIVPSARLSADQYTVRLSGISSSNAPESVGSYSFRATK